jgi:tRNA G46 methylase TrmB
LCDADGRLDGGVIRRPDWRPFTRYERKAVDAGRRVTDLFYRRR